MNVLREIKLYNGDILTLTLDQIESTEIPDPQKVRKKAYIRTKSGMTWEVARIEAVHVTMAWRSWAEGVVKVG